jgi:phosphopantothenoylcysteine synthetase/decarboxylase
VSVPGIGFDAPENEVTLLTRAGERELPRAAKEQIAGGIVDEIERLLEERRHGSA